MLAAVPHVAFPVPVAAPPWQGQTAPAPHVPHPPEPVPAPAAFRQWEEKPPPECPSRRVRRNADAPQPSTDRPAFRSAWPPSIPPVTAKCTARSPSSTDAIIKLGVVFALALLIHTERAKTVA